MTKKSHHSFNCLVFLMFWPIGYYIDSTMAIVKLNFHNIFQLHSLNSKSSILAYYKGIKGKVWIICLLWHNYYVYWKRMLNTHNKRKAIYMHCGCCTCTLLWISTSQRQKRPKVIFQLVIFSLTLLSSSH